MKERIQKQIDKIKNFNYKDYISTNKLFFTFVITTLINGMLLRFFTVHNYFAIKPIMADLALILLLGSFVYLFKPRNRFKYLMILSIIFTAVCVINSLYYTYSMFIRIILTYRSIFNCCRCWGCSCKKCTSI